MAVIMGVIHMSLGVFIKGTNAVYFRKYVDLWTEVITGMIILLGLFGWMDALIIGKWFHRIDIEDTTPSQDISSNRLYYDTDDEMMKKEDKNYILKYAGDVANENTPSVIQIMIV